MLIYSQTEANMFFTPNQWLCLVLWTMKKEWPLPLCHLDIMIGRVMNFCIHSRYYWNTLPVKFQGNSIIGSYSTTTPSLMPSGHRGRGWIYKSWYLFNHWHDHHQTCRGVLVSCQNIAQKVSDFYLQWLPNRWTWGPPIRICVSQKMPW